MYVTVNLVRGGGSQEICLRVAGSGTRADSLFLSCVCILWKGGAANNRNVLFPSHGGRKSTIQDWAGSVSPDGCERGCVPGLSPGMGEAVCALCLHVIFPLCVSASPSVPFYKDTVPLDLSSWRGHISTHNVGCLTVFSKNVLFISFQLCWVFVVPRASSSFGAPASPCSVFSCCRAWALGVQAQ